MTSCPGHRTHSGRPLTPGERLIWTGQRLDPDVPLYNMAIAWDIDGEIDVEALSEALRRVVEDADALRTVVRIVDGEPACYVLPQADVQLGQRVLRIHRRLSP